LSDTPAPHFADELITRLRDLGHPLCVGLDPHLNRIPPLFQRGDMRPSCPETPGAVEAFLLAVLDRLQGRVAIVKPQIAFFEQLGWPGLRMLERVTARARERDILVLLDAKRGDIGSTADGYAKAYLEPESPLPVDAITLNPYLGLDTLEPFAARARDHGRGLFVLVKTSNPGSGDLQDLELSKGEAGRTVFAAVADSLASLGAELRGPATGWSSLGVVVGATYPGQAIEVRERLPHSLFLVPGYGAQGASASEAMQGFVRGPKGLEGGLVSSSRGILFAADAHVSDASAWEAAFDHALEAAIEELSEGVAKAR
jgi:orotidine-5'-phosphate decarboxylase